MTFVKGGPDGDVDVAERQARNDLLRAFTDDTRRLLDDNASPFGRLIASHIGRQLELIFSARYTAWFQADGEAAGFDQFVTAAAIAGSDVTRTASSSEAARAGFGSTADRVRSLASQGALRYGRPFKDFSGLEDVYMHAEGGRQYALDELRRRGSAAIGFKQSETIARNVSDAIIGHDSFNAGFGHHRLKPMLAARHGGHPESFDYPTSQTPDGFLVQILDRLEGFEPDTMARYVTEGVMHRNEPISAAILVGIIDNLAFLREVYGSILHDAGHKLQAQALTAFRSFPGLRDFAEQLEQSAILLALLGTPPKPQADGFYHVRCPAGDVALNSLEALNKHFIVAVRELQTRLGSFV